MGEYDLDVNFGLDIILRFSEHGRELSREGIGTSSNREVFQLQEPNYPIVHLLPETLAWLHILQ